MSSQDRSATAKGPGASFGKTHHWIVLACLFVLLGGAALLWSTRGLGRTDPFELHGSTAAIGTRAAINRDAALLGHSLRCMDWLRKSAFKQTVRECTLVLDLDPKNVTALSLRGSAFAQMKLYDKALADFSRTVALSPAFADGYRLRGGAYALQNRPALALADFNRAIALAPNDPQNVEARGHLHQMRGEYALAIADFSAAIARAPMLARTWNSRCWTRLLGHAPLDQALADCNRSLQLDASSANAYDSRGYVLYQLNRFAPAIADFSKAIDLNANLASAWYGRGLSKLRIKDLSAPRDIARAKTLEPAIADRFAAYGIRPQANGPSGA